MGKQRIALPSQGAGGLDGLRAGHFGHCDVFTLVDVDDGEITGSSILPNIEHVQGGCMAPVKLLADNNVDVIIVGGIGLRPLMGFKQVGIRVYHEKERSQIRPVLDDMLAGRIPLIQEDEVCGAGSQQ